MVYSKTWYIMEGKHANHDIEIKYTVHNRKLNVRISGPRSSSTNLDRCVKRNVDRKLTRRTPFLSPSPTQIADNAWELYKDAKKRIDQAIAEHAKKHEEDYQ